MAEIDAIELQLSNLFPGEEHRPFFWQGGAPAALLIHGFMGTPAEMRPLAQDLHQAGWTVEGLLLPGFGDQLDTLLERRGQDWLEAVSVALGELAARHRPVLLVGYSLGGALALKAAVDNPPDGLVVLAPFWRIGTALQRLVWAVIRRLRTEFQPFKGADFSDPSFEAFFGELMPELDLTVPGVQETLRQLRVPARFVDEVLGVGAEAKWAATQIEVPTQIIQGEEDETVRPKFTRQLLQNFSGPVSYKEVPLGHDLFQKEHPGYSHLAQTVLSFARMVQQPAQ